MTPEDLDRILSSDETLVPSSGFAAGVIARAREAAAPPPPPLPFPWRRYVLGLFVLIAMSGLWGWFGVRLNVMAPVGAAFDSALAAIAGLSLPLAEAAASLVGTYVVVRLTLSFSGARR